MAARLFSAAVTSDKCGCCHLCSSDTQGNSQQKEPAWDVETRVRIPYHMESRMACANIRNPEGKCLKKLAMMALAVGKEAAIFSLIGDSSVGRKLKVCVSAMFRVTNRENVQCAIVPACIMHCCMCLQVYHYTGVTKDQGISAWDPKSMGEGIPDDDVWHTDELQASVELGKDANTCASESAGINEEHGQATLEDAQHPLVAAVREGQFFEGTIKRVDESAQACFVVFKDGDCGWLQLWRAGEVVMLLDN
jgi:hypothetical protein